MIARLIENWLANANERGYEVPFCQLLMAEGHRVIHLNRHSPTEQGKDIISIDAAGRLCAFQLKGGDIDLSRWRKEIKPEVVPLIEQMVEHPTVKPGFAIPHLVTNGRLKEPVVAEVNSLNRSNQDRGLKPLTINVGTELTARFVDCHGQYLPREPQDFDEFLRLFLADGHDMLPKGRVTRFLASQLDPKQLKKTTDTARTIASTILLAAYALSPYQRCGNHFAVFEGWILVAAYVARLAESKSIARKTWMPSFQLALGAACLAMKHLVGEATSGRELVEGIPMMEGGPPYRARLTILVGIAAAYSLMRRMSPEGFTDSTELIAFIEKHQSHMLLWGESAIPFFMSLALWNEQRGQSGQAESIVSELIEAITVLNGLNSRTGLPSPYYGVSRCIAAMCRVRAIPILNDSPIGASYALRPLVEFLVRRGRKTALRAQWSGITDIRLAENAYTAPQDTYLWRSTDSKLEELYVKRPQSWNDLLTQARADVTKNLPSTLRTEPGFALMFMLVYPHRFSRTFLNLIDRQIDSECAKR